MASTTTGGARGRRKQAKPQRKVELDINQDANSQQFSATILTTEIAATASSMSPDTNHNELTIENHNELRKGATLLKEGAVPPEEVLTNGLLLLQRVASFHQNDEEIAEYMDRSDTAVIYPESTENVPTITNGLHIGGGKDPGEDSSSTAGSEYFIKCPQCQKGYQTFQSLKEHMDISHPDLCASGVVAATAADALSMSPTSRTPSAVSPTPSLAAAGPGGPYGCAQCTASFATKDQLEKHELLHSPNAQVSCKICNKTFANVYRLQRHMISHDESAVLRKFKCTQCDKAFKFKHHLKEHIRIHSGEKPFECANCGKRFSHSGSYSSHMTSKKCLVMNLKLGRTRSNATSNSTSLLEPSAKRKRNNNNNNNNNNIVVTSANHNAYMPILPKYTEAAAAAFLQTSLQNPAVHPFYMTPQGILQANGHLNPFSVPALNHLMEQLQQQQHQHHNHQNGAHEIKSEPIDVGTEHVVKSEASSCAGDLVMDDEDDVNNQKDQQPIREEVNGAGEIMNGANGDLEAVKRILETVNATVTKQFLQANMQKFSSDNSRDSVRSSGTHSPHSGGSGCSHCKKGADEQRDCHCIDHQEVKSEGLAAKLEDAVASKDESAHNSEEDQDKNHEYEVDNESVTTTTDQLTEDGRKVRVRSLISDEQLKVLKDNYALNPRPKREELAKIAELIGFPVRVVQVWFQNTRARDRREGRLIINNPISYQPPLIQTSRFPNAAPSKWSPQYEQPLDLSTKKEPLSRESSPSRSPLRRPASSHHHSDSGEEAVNLSRKSSPMPFQNLQPHYQEPPRSTPSPLDFNNSKLAQILAQPHKLAALQGMSIVPNMERLMQFGPADLPALSQLINNRISSISPNSGKRSWENAENIIVDEEEAGGKRKVPAHHLMIKNLGSPMLGNQEAEGEGQFSCDQCDKAFSKQSSLARHKYEHSGQRPHKCDECPKAFKHKHHLTEHKRLHSGEKPFQCSKCLKRFSHSGSYSQHMNHRYSYCKPYRE